MTVAEWVASREPAAPPALATHMLRALGEDGGRPAREAAAVCLAAGERLAAALQRSDAASRASALDLLTADALVTLAFEAASDTPDQIDGLSLDAMHRFAKLAP